MTITLGNSQTLPFTFSNANELFVGGDCITSLTTDPNDASNAVLQVVGGGGDYDNAQKVLTPVNLSDDANNSIFFRIKPINGTGSGKHLFKFENGTGGPAQTEVPFTTTGTDWQNIEINFGAGLGSYPKIVIFTDFVNTSIDTYLIDDIRLGKSTGSTPALPFTFSNANELFVGDNCATSLTTDPNDINNAVMQVVGGGGDYDNAQKDLTPVNLSDDSKNTIFFRIKPMNGTGSGNHLFKFEQGTGGANQIEKAFTTSGTNWQNIEVNYGSGLGSYIKMVIFTDFANGSSDTYLIDDIRVGESTGPTLTQINLPVTFEGADVDYTVTDFEGTASTKVVDPTDASNTVIKTIKGTGAKFYAGTSIGKNGLGFSSAIPFTESNRKMYVRVWSPTAGTPVMLKIEDALNGANSCETITNTTVANGWQTLEFDFNVQRPGTAAFNQTFTYKLATIFFNFVVDAPDSPADVTYYFDDVTFGAPLATNQFETSKVRMYPNPASNRLTIEAKSSIEKVSIYNVLGQQMLTKNPKSQSTTLDISNLQNGVYVVTTTIDGKVASTRIVKN